ncbi:MAG: hypothetical protein WD894_23260 [Pirellulales bacterium]
MRFSTRRLLEVVAFMALLCMMLFALPDTAAFWSLVLTTLAVPSLAIPVIVYGRGNVHAFAIGVLSSFGLTPFALWFIPFAAIFGSPMRLMDSASPGDAAEVRAWKIFFAAILSWAVLTGLTSIAIRYACRKQESDDSAVSND